MVGQPLSAFPKHKRSVAHDLILRAGGIAGLAAADIAVLLLRPEAGAESSIANLASTLTPASTRVKPPPVGADVRRL